MPKSQEGLVLTKYPITNCNIIIRVIIIKQKIYVDLFDKLENLLFNFLYNKLSPIIDKNTKINIIKGLKLYLL